MNVAIMDEHVGYPKHRDSKSLYGVFVWLCVCNIYNLSSYAIYHLNIGHTKQNAEKTILHKGKYSTEAEVRRDAFVEETIVIKKKIDRSAQMQAPECKYYHSNAERLLLASLVHI